MGQLRQSRRFASFRSDLCQVQGWTYNCVHFLSPSAGGGNPQIDGIHRDANHGRACHEVADCMSPPGVFIALVDHVLPCKELEEEDTRTDGRSDDGPAPDEEVAGVVANHVMHCKSEPSCSEAPGYCDALKKHQEKETHATCGVLIEQLEHVDPAPRNAGKSDDIGDKAHNSNKYLFVFSQVSGPLIRDSSNEAFHRTKLGVEAEEHQHEKEETGPEGRPGHLKNGTRISKKSKTRA